VESLRETLFRAYKHLIQIKGECSCEITSQCGISDLTIRQIEYLKLMDAHHEVTFSKLAELTCSSKPTVSELIHKLIMQKCIYREKSPLDKRVSYIYLTEKGKGIARIEESTIYKVVDRILGSLHDDEINILIQLFKKVK
jgi:DNA-binding MarR family transcriptional regulator